MKAIPATICLILITAMPSCSFAQVSASRYSIGLMGGAFAYQGDLADGAQGSLRTSRPGLTVWGARRFGPGFSVRLGLSLASLRGDETLYQTPAYRKERALAFQSPLIELSPQILFTPFGGLQQRSRVSTYLIAGLSLVWMNVQRDASRFNAAYFSEAENLPTRLATDLSRNPPQVVPAIPLGAGIRYQLGERFNLHTEFLWRYTFSDYLDGFSAAANPSQRDHYYSIMAGVSFRFGRVNNLDCPPIRY
jgi:hypothetical protein